MIEKNLPLKEIFPRRYLSIDKMNKLDIIGDIHGCFDELVELLNIMGYKKQGDIFIHEDGYVPVFVGDLVDRGPKNKAVLDLVRNMVLQTKAFATLGNHDEKFCRWLLGKKVKISHGIVETIAQLQNASDSWKDEMLDFLTNLPLYILADNKELAISHAGIKEHMIGEMNGEVRSFCLYGEQTGKYDDFGYPIRVDWAESYRGQVSVVHGHVAIDNVRHKNNVWNVDTSCVFGGYLSALRWNTKEIFSVKSKVNWHKPIIEHS